ncbi:MAG: hypothetical protein AAB516_00755 [Patescibacteria group bacterium]
MIKFNEKIAVRVFGILAEIWHKKKGIFSKVVLPQDIYLPKFKNNRDMANWFFYSALPMRGGLISEDPMKWLFALYKANPEIFNPVEVSVKWNAEKILDAFKNVTSGIINGNGKGKNGGGALSYKMDEHARAWYENSVVLSKYWGGDLRNVYWGCIDFEEAFRRVDYYRTKAGFKGMRRKIFSLLTIWLQEKNLIPIFPGPIPVDFHALRIMCSTDIIDFKKTAKPFIRKNSKHPEALAGKLTIRISEKFMDTAAKWTQKFLYKSNLSYMYVNPAVWVLSRELCAKHVQNASRSNGSKFNETEIEKFSSKKYREPCGSCPIEEFCKWSFPAAPYYKWGLLTRIGKRVSHPQQVLRGVDWGDFLTPKRSMRR